MHLWVLLGHLSPLATGPYHESIHGPFDMVASLWSRTHHALLEEGPEWTGTRMKPWALLAQQWYSLILGLQLSWISDPSEPMTLHLKKTLEFWRSLKRALAAWEEGGSTTGAVAAATCHPRVLWPHSSTLVGREGLGGRRHWPENNGRGGHVAGPNNGEDDHMTHLEDVPTMRRRPTTNDMLLVRGPAYKIHLQ